MRPTSDTLFTFAPGGVPARSYERCSALDLGLSEDWLQTSVVANPEIVIGACRAAGLTDDIWYTWEREFSVDVGKVDVLLLSSQGRIAIVETKLARNPESRRRVLAQVLDYLGGLSEALQHRMPEFPDGDDIVASKDDILESVAQGDVLVVIASDAVDVRVARLSQALLAQHMVKPWDLALVDVALYRPTEGSASNNHLVVPQLRHVVKAEARQIVRVIVEGETPAAHVVITTDDTATGEMWPRDRFLRNIDRGGAPPATTELVRQLLALEEDSPILSITWGRATYGSMILKRDGHGLIELYGDGFVRFRRDQIKWAVGDERGAIYISALERLFPKEMALIYPRIRPGPVANAAGDLYRLVEAAVAESVTGGLTTPASELRPSEGDPIKGTDS